MSDLPTPITRKEQFLNSIARGNTSDLPTPITREEAYLDAIAKNGGGSGDGDMKKSVYDSDLAVANAGGISAFVDDAISGKVDKVEGKGLSTNDYDDTEKGKVTANAKAIEAMVNVNGCCNIAPKLDFTSKVIDGVTWTVINDGKFIVNGTASDWSVAQTPKFYLPAGTYHLDSGAQNPHNTYLVVVDEDGVTNYANTVDIGNTDFTLATGKTVSVHCVVRSGETVNNEVFYAMLYDARLTPTGYVPYAMTNRELTERMKVTKGTYISDSGLATIAVEKLAGYYLAGVTCNHAGGYLCSFSNHSSTDYYVVIMDFDATNNTISFMKGFETELILTWIKE